MNGVCLKIACWLCLFLSVLFLSEDSIGQTLERYRNDMEFSFSENSAIQNDYFERYHIEKKDKLYYIYVVKNVDVGYNKMVAVMNDFDALPDYMPGYRSIQVKYSSDTTLLAGVVFRPTFSPFSSQFTNAIEIVSDNTAYLQCWRQMDPSDSQILLPFKNAPLYNKGYIELWPLKNGKVKFVYLSILEPPIPVPNWIYRLVVRNTYVEVFEAFIEEARKE